VQYGWAENGMLHSYRIAGHTGRPMYAFTLMLQMWTRDVEAVFLVLPIGVTGRYVALFRGSDVTSAHVWKRQLVHLVMQHRK
jgi:hypothetical protein